MLLSKLLNEYFSGPFALSNSLMVDSSTCDVQEGEAKEGENSRPLTFCLLAPKNTQRFSS